MCMTALRTRWDFTSNRMQSGLEQPNHPNREHLLCNTSEGETGTFQAV